MRIDSRAATFLLVAALSACGRGRTARGPGPASRSLPPREPFVSIVLQHVQPGDEWKVTYHFAEPVVAARFRRPGYAIRARFWRAVEPSGLRIEHTPDGDRGFSFVDGRPFQDVTFEFATYLQGASDYDLFDRFTDGSVVVYTGHFDVVPVVCRRPSASPCAESDLDEVRKEEPNHFVLAPAQSERLVFQGRVSDAAMAWNGDSEGNWAYFGSVTPVESPHLVAVLDPGLPPWLRAKLEQLLPDIFGLYADRTGQSLDYRPIVYFAFNPLPSDRGVGIGGGTRTGSMWLLVDLGRSYMTQPSDVVVERIAFLFAHEGAHLWNGHMFTQDGEEDDWLHEGGADAFAFRALRHFGVTSPARYEEQLSEAASTCMLALDGGPVEALGRRGRYEGDYVCGSTIGLLTEAAVARAHPGLDLFDVWKRMFALSKGRHYGKDLYYQALASVAGEEAVGPIRTLVEGPLSSSAPAALLERELGVPPLAAREEAPSMLPDRYEELAGRWALSFLVEKDCGAVGNRLTFDAGRAEVVDGAGCAHFRTGGTISSLGGFDLKREGARAFDYLVTQCRQHEGVELSGAALAGGEGGVAATVPCDKALDPRPPFVRLVASPPVR